MSTQPPEDDDRTVIRPAAPRPAAPVAAPAPISASIPAPTASDHAIALPVGLHLGEFELTGVLGEGGFGIVYLAWDHSLERRVAVKEYMPSALAARGGATQVQVKSERHRETFEAGRKSFVNEAKLLAQFDHPSLVKVYRFWEANGTAYMAMPFYEGVTLKERLREFGAPPDEAWLMALLDPLTAALAVIHAENCFHRDIAPDNVILLNGSGRPLLLDFGAARRVIGDMTQALTVILKPGYAPVEQYAEAPGMKQGPWTDVYALAASVYFALLGKTPPPSVSRLMGDTYVPLAESCAGRYSPRFLAAIDQALRVRPEERTQTMDALRADLGLDAAQVSSHETQLRLPGRGDGAAAGATVRAGHRSSGLRAGLAIGALALAAVAGLGWYLARGKAYQATTASAHDTVPPAPPTAVEPKPAADTSAPPRLEASSPSVAAPPLPTPAPAPSPALDPAAEFQRVLDARTPGFDLQAVAARQELRIGRDNLSFSVQSARAGYLTVLVLGPDGSLVQLFPNRETPRVKVQAGQTLRLPPPGVTIATGEPAGTERFLTIVTKTPRSYTTLGAVEKDGYLELPTGRPLPTRPSGLPALLGDAVDCTDQCDEFGAASFELQVVK